MTADDPATQRPTGAGAPLILRPELTFHELARALDALGWQRDSTRPCTPDMIPGEPELAGFRSRSGDGLLSYTLNPVVRLRVLAPHHVRPDEIAELERRLPLLRSSDALLLLQSENAAEALLGVLAAELLEDPALLGAVQRLGTHPQPSVARAAERAKVRLEKLDRARRDTLELLAFIAGAVRPILAALPGPLGPEMILELRPRPEDYPLVFRGDAASKARTRYDELWREPPEIHPASGATELDVYASPAGMFRSDNELSRNFPQAYRAVAHELVPERIWITWRYRKPSERSGLRFDGLVWLDGRWAWFPKPFRALEP